MNGSGLVVGAAQTASGAWHATLWEGGAVTDLGTLAGGSQSFAYGVNDAGRIVGAAEIPSDGYTGYTGLVTLHAVVWERHGTAIERTDLGTLGGGFGRAIAINEHGDIAGITYRLGGSGKVFSGAVRWSSGSAVDLPMLPDDTGSSSAAPA